MARVFVPSVRGISRCVINIFKYGLHLHPASQIDIAVIGASEADNQGNCNGIHGKSACGPLAYSAIDAKLAQHVIVVTDNLVEYPCTPMSINETNVDYVVLVPTIGDPKKITSGTTRLTSDPQQLLIGEYCVRLMEALGLITPDLVFQVSQFYSVGVSQPGRAGIRRCLTCPWDIQRIAEGEGELAALLPSHNRWAY